MAYFNSPCPALPLSSPSLPTLVYWTLPICKRSFRSSKDLLPTQTLSHPFWKVAFSGNSGLYEQVIWWRTCALSQLGNKLMLSFLLLPSKSLIRVCPSSLRCTLSQAHPDSCPLILGWFAMCQQISNFRVKRDINFLIKRFGVGSLTFSLLFSPSL